VLADKSKGSLSVALGALFVEGSVSTSQSGTGREQGSFLIESGPLRGRYRRGEVNLTGVGHACKISLF